MTIDPTEIETVMSLPADDRFEFFIDQVIETGVIWGLVKESWAIFFDDEQGYQLLPFWSDEAFAEANKVGEWEDYNLISFELDEFSLESANSLKEGNVDISIFKSPNDIGKVMSAIELQTLLIEKYNRRMN